MSNRYVWNRYAITYTSQAADMPADHVSRDETRWTLSTLGLSIDIQFIVIGESFALNNGLFTLQTNAKVIAYPTSNTELFNYFADGNYIHDDDTINCEVLEFYAGLSADYSTTSTQFSTIYKFRFVPWGEDRNAEITSVRISSAYDYLRMRGFTTEGTCDITGQKISAVGNKGTANGTVSNSGASTYPQDGISGNYWYTYQGQDSIDATAVGYSSQAPMGGQPITINVTPTTPTYGGTIRYTYQVKLSGGEWTTISSNNTATSLQYTIPAGTTSFAARVLASDTWGFSSSDYTTGATLTVTNNLPPSAPDGITIGDVLGGQQCTITWGAATDSDGTIAQYQLERNVDNGDTWTQIYSGLALTYDDMINSEWATVNYRVRAVDDDGEAGPYATGTAKVVNAGWLYFSGPDADMGDKPAPFDFVFSIGSTTEGTTDISVSVLLDDENVYTGTPDAAEQVSVHIDTRLMFAGEHVLVITAEKQNLLGLNQECTFTVPAVTLPDGGRMVQLYNDEGQPVFPLTLGRAVIGKGGEDVNEILDRVFSGAYTGTGTSGSGNPCQLRLSFVPRFMFVYSNGTTPASGWWIRTAEPTVEAQGTMETTGGTATVTWDNDNMTLSWYAASAAVQLNTSGTVYGYLVIG